MCNWWDNKAMTAVEPLQHKGKAQPNPRSGQHPYLTLHYRHNPLGAIKPHNNLFVEPCPAHINITSRAGSRFFPPLHLSTQSCPREAFILIKENKDRNKYMSERVDRSTCS